MDLVEHVPPRIQPQEISVPLPKSLHTTAHVHLTFLDGDGDKKRSDNNAPTSVMAFLTATTPGDSGVMAKPMGSFVYAMPDVRLHQLNQFSNFVLICVAYFNCLLQRFH